MKAQGIAGGERPLLAVVVIETARDGGAAAPDAQALRLAIGPDGAGSSSSPAARRPW